MFDLNYGNHWVSITSNVSGVAKPEDESIIILNSGLYSERRRYDFTVSFHKLGSSKNTKYRFYSHGQMPPIIASDMNERLFVGYNETIAFFNLQTQELLFSEDFDGSVIYYAHIREKSIIVISELLVCILSSTGDHLFEHHLEDVIRNFRFEEENLLYETDSHQTTILDMNTYTRKSEGGHSNSGLA